jgi:choline dehydrogenase-like flavoprotein
MSSPDEFDIAIVGGGLVGGAIGYGLARSGLHVALLDEGDVAYRASRGNFGLVWVQGKGLGLAPYSNWTQLSARRWPELAALLRADADTDVVLEQPGGFHLCLSERELNTGCRSERDWSATRTGRYPFDVLDHALRSRRIPGIGSAVVGGTGALDGHECIKSAARIPNMAASTAQHKDQTQNAAERFLSERRTRRFGPARSCWRRVGQSQLAPLVGLVARSVHAGTNPGTRTRASISAPSDRDVATNRRRHGIGRRFAGGSGL